MINEDYDKLSPNAKMLALRKQKQKIEEQIKQLEAEYTKCECGYFFDINKVTCEYETYVRNECFPSLCEFDDAEYRDVKYADTVFYCPVCGKKHIKNHYFITIL